MLEKMTQLTQDEIVSSTKTVISGLESLKIEHHASIQALESSLKTVPLSQSQDDNQSLNEKSGILHKSMEMIDIGIEEAKVREIKFHCFVSTFIFVINCSPLGTSLVIKS